MEVRQPEAVVLCVELEQEGVQAPGGRGFRGTDRVVTGDRKMVMVDMVRVKLS